MYNAMLNPCVETFLDQEYLVSKTVKSARFRKHLNREDFTTRQPISSV